MKLLNDIILYAIKVDYFMYSETKGDYTEPRYFAIDTETTNKDGECMNLIIMKKNVDDPCIRVFDTEREAKRYIREHKSYSYEKPRVIKIIYDFKNKKWKEI